MSNTVCPWCGAYSPRSCEMREEMTGDICPWEESGEYEADMDRLREDRDEFDDIEAEMYFNLTDFYESVWPGYSRGALARARATILAYEASKKEREGENDNG